VGDAVRPALEAADVVPVEETIHFIVARAEAQSCGAGEVLEAAILARSLLAAMVLIPTSFAFLIPPLRLRVSARE
jgi:hypothetical protein